MRIYVSYDTEGKDALTIQGGGMNIKDFVIAMLLVVAVAASAAWWVQSKRYAAAKTSLELAQAKVAMMEAEQAKLSDAMRDLQNTNQQIQQRATAAHRRVSKQPAEEVPKAIREALEAIQ